MVATMPKPVIHLIAGARPNFMKIAPLVRALQRDGRLAWQIVHTGQHRDRLMNAVFFEELGIPSPDISLGCRGGTSTEQVSQIMQAYGACCRERQPALTLVVGDVNSTLACALAAKQMGIALVHVEAGLRSGDRSMPEEINRRLVDSISDWFFVSEPAALANLQAEGCDMARVHHVGQVMADNLRFQVERLSLHHTDLGAADVAKRSALERAGRYGVVTLHRAATVDDPAVLSGVLTALRQVAIDLPLLFPVHPRTRQSLQALGPEAVKGLHLMEPQGYMDFLHLWKDAAIVLTDSGGLQEETTVLGVPCLTLRDNTERPITVEQGSNELVGTQSDKIVEAARRALGGERRRGRCPVLWDGLATQRIVSVLADALCGHHMGVH